MIEREREIDREIGSWNRGGKKDRERGGQSKVEGKRGK